MNGFGLFEVAITLDTTVRRRTMELRSALRSVERTNEALKKAKAQADQANAFKSTFLAFVSHDLLQPLNAAKLSLSALTELETNPSSAGFVRQVDQCAGQPGRPDPDAARHFQARRGRHAARRLRIRDRAGDRAVADRVRAARRRARVEAPDAALGRICAVRSAAAAAHPSEPRQQCAALRASRRRAGRMPQARRHAAHRGQRHRPGHSGGSSRGDLGGVPARRDGRRGARRLRARPFDRSPPRRGAGSPDRSRFASRVMARRSRSVCRSTIRARSRRSGERSIPRLSTMASTAPMCCWSRTSRAVAQAMSALLQRWGCRVDCGEFKRGRAATPCAKRRAGPTS